MRNSADTQACSLVVAKPDAPVEQKDEMASVEAEMRKVGILTRALVAVLDVVIKVLDTAADALEVSDKAAAAYRNAYGDGSEPSGAKTATGPTGMYDLNRDFAEREMRVMGEASWPSGRKLTDREMDYYGVRR